MRSQFVVSLLAIAVCVGSAAVGEVAFAREPSAGAGPADLPAAAAADTVRTNLWLTEALMAEIIQVAAQALPAAPAGILLVPGDDTPGTELFGATAFAILADGGYRLFAPPAAPDSVAAAATDSVAAAAVDSVATPTTLASPPPWPEVDGVFGYRVLGVDLAYPQVGRTLGIWRRWVDRRVRVTAMVEITDARTGRLLLNRKLERSFADRLEAADLADVDSPLYEFTSAQTAESGWHSRVEEIVVLGTLAGLVAVYFANTTD